MSDLLRRFKSASEQNRNVHLPRLGDYLRKGNHGGQKTRTLLNPKCILEILSDSTEKYDRGEKFSHYQNLESLEEYILISQNQTKAESFLRQADNKWLYQKVEGSESELSIHSVNAKIKLEEIYKNTEELEDNLNS